MDDFWFEKTARECQEDKESLYDQGVQKIREVVTFTVEEQGDIFFTLDLSQKAEKRW